MKNLAVTVLLVQSFTPPQVWNLELPAASRLLEVADHAFRISNCPTHLLDETDREILAKFPRSGLRSISVGDVLIIQDPENPDSRHILSLDYSGFIDH